MPKRYYLSRFIGSGTESDPFRSLTAKFQESGIVDLRPDEKQQNGWCFACANIDGRTDDAPEAGLIYLGEDPNVPLQNSTISVIKENLGIDFKSQTLAEILAEILLFQRLPGRGLRQGIDGNYQIHCCGPLWEATEEEAYEFVGKLRESELLGHPSDNSSKRLTDLRPALADALTYIADIVNHQRPGWLDTEVQKINPKQSNHPLATDYFEARKLLEASNATLIHRSAAATSLLKLACDLRAIGSQLDVERLGSRLRTAHDCEPTQYELHVMAAYIEAGVRVEKTDENSTGEFRISNGGEWVHVECKCKGQEIVRRRRVKAVFDKGNDLLRKLMEEKNSRALVQISCRTDPNEQDLPTLIACVSRGLDEELDQSGSQIRRGKFEISFLPADWITADVGLKVPYGFDYGFTEATLEESVSDELRLGCGWGVMWRVQRPGGWIRSVVDSIREASAQVPSHTPNLVYLHVPGRNLGAVTTRMDTVEPEVRDLLSSLDRYKRVNAVVLTGQAMLSGWIGPDIKTLRYLYRIVENQKPRNALPSNFRIFGRDFTRMPPPAK